MQNAGTLSLSADEASMVMAATQIVSGAIALLVVDRLGRRVLLMSSAGVMGACCVAMGLYFYLNVSAPSSAWRVAAVRGLAPLT